MKIMSTKLKYARYLRRNLSEAEKRLWYLLRSRRLKDFKFKKQQVDWVYNIFNFNKQSRNCTSFSFLCVSLHPLFNICVLFVPETKHISLEVLENKLVTAFP